MFNLIYTFNIKVDAAENVENKIYCNASVNDKFASDRVLVVLDEEASYSDKTYTVDDFKTIGCCFVTEFTEHAIEKYRESNIDIEKLNYKRVLNLELESSSKENVLDVIEELMKRNDVLYAGPDYEISIESTTPSDYDANIQWAIDNIDLPEAWDFTTGSNNVVVGVIDSGIDGNHPDLRDLIINDLCRDFTSGSEVNVTAPIDPNGHGTRVAGIIGAIGNNGIGCVGVNWDVSLVSLRVVDERGSGYSSHVAEAIKYAGRNGIPILNMSLGWYEGNSRYDYALDSVINTYSGLVVCSAGNNGVNTDDNLHYPSSCTASNMISVGAHDKDNKRSIWSSTKSSNYGTNTVHIYAPGGKNNKVEINEIGSDENCYTTSANSTYRYFNGTSCASPHVAGVAALLLSMDSNLTALDLKNIILNSAEIINITLPNESTQSVKKLNAFNAIKYYLFEYYTPNLYSLTANGLSVENTIYPDSSCYNNQNMFIKLNVTNSCDYEFVAFANNYSIDVKLFDSNLNEVSISKTYMETNRRITFNINLSIGEYYVRVYSSYSEPQIVDLDINSSHTHSYRYRTYSSTQHKAICSCGASILQYHMVDTSGCCVLCLAIVSSGISPLTLNNVNYITENGSYILPNGVIIIVEADMDSFIKNKTDIYSLL